MPDFTVHQYGHDVYGRPVLQTAYYHQWEHARWESLGFDLPIAQGGFMSRIGGGAVASDGAHDLAACCDYIISHLTDVESEAVVREFRKNAGAAYRRGPDPKHGNMPAHLHNTLATDEPKSSMAQILWNSYVAGGDGLAGGDGRPADAPDYEWRPKPLILTPPKDWFAMATKADLKQAIREVLAEDGLVEAPKDDVAFSGGSTSIVGALKRIWNLSPKGA